MRPGCATSARGRIDPRLAQRHPIQARARNKTVPASPDSGKQPANVVTATTTMEVIQEAQLIAPGQVPVRPSSAKDTQAVGLLHLLRYTLPSPQVLPLISSFAGIFSLNR